MPCGHIVLAAHGWVENPSVAVAASGLCTAFHPGNRENFVPDDPNRLKSKERKAKTGQLPQSIPLVFSKNTLSESDNNN